MAGATGLEPAASGVTGRRSNQLSYAPAGFGPRRHSYPSHPGGVKADRAGSEAQVIPGLAWITAAMPRGRASTAGMVGDEGFEPPTPSV